jgi:hypothetical protein
MKPDWPLALQCYLRSNDREWAALMVLNGQGIKHDRELAEALLKRPDCAHCARCSRKLARRIAEHVPIQPLRTVRACDVFVDSVCGYRCAGITDAKRQWAIEQKLQRHRKRFSRATLKKLEKLYQASAKLAEADASYVYHIYIDGSARNPFYSRRKRLIGAQFDITLLALFEGALARVTAKDVALANRALQLVDVNPGPKRKLFPDSPAVDLAKSWRMSRQRYRRYEAAWRRLVSATNPRQKRALRYRLLVQRLYCCLWSPTSHQKKIHARFVKKLRRYGKKPAHRLHKQLDAASDFEDRLFE